MNFLKYSMAAPLLVFVTSMFPSGLVFGGWEIKAVRLAGVPTEIRLLEKGAGLIRVRVKSGGSWFEISECNVKLCATAGRHGFKKYALPRDALADAVLGLGKNDIAKAWLSKPTRRYGRGRLGDGIEAGALVVTDRIGKRYQYSLPITEVFEDRYARVVDLDGDKTDEVVVVLSSFEHGASLAIFKLIDNVLVKAAQTRPLGPKGSWLNPAGIADFDGDGKVEIALVRNPEINGRLELWQYRSGKLNQMRSLRGFSNHATGSNVLNMSAQADFDRDGKIDLALPGRDRNTLRIISLAGGMVAEPVHIKLPGRVVTEVVSVSLNGHPVVLAGLDSGIIVLVRNNVAVVAEDVPSWYKKNNETSLLSGFSSGLLRRSNGKKALKRIELGKPNR